MIKDAAKRSHVRTESQLVDHFRTLAERLRSLNDGPDNETRTVGVTSCLPGEGVSTVAANLAATTAMLFNRPVLLVEANLVRPSIGKWLGLADETGLADVLMGSVDAGDAVRDSGEHQLSVLTAGSAVARTPASFDAGRLRQLLDDLKGDYDLILVDLPAATPTSSCWTIARALDGVLLVVEAERISSASVHNVQRRLAGAGANLLGVVLNKQREPQRGRSGR